MKNGIEKRTELCYSILRKRRECHGAFVSYAECSHEAYASYKAQCPCLFDRGQLMERYRHLFSYFHVMFDKQRKHKDFTELLNQRKKEPLSTRSISIFYASPFGTVMTEYNAQPTAGWRTLSSAFAGSCRLYKS